MEVRHEHQEPENEVTYRRVFVERRIRRFELETRMETIKGPVTIGGNLFFGLSAVMEHKGRMIVVVAENVGDIRDAWDSFRLDTPTLPELDETLLQKVVIGAREKISA